MKKIIVREVKACGASKVIVGTSKTRHKIRSSVSLAKYCARKLSKDFGVYAVDYSKIIFQRQASNTNINILQGFHSFLLLLGFLFKYIYIFWVFPSFWGF